MFENLEISDAVTLFIANVGEMPTTMVVPWDVYDKEIHTASVIFPTIKFVRDNSIKAIDSLDPKDIN